MCLLSIAFIVKDNAADSCAGFFKGGGGAHCVKVKLLYVLLCRQDVGLLRKKLVKEGGKVHPRTPLPPSLHPNIDVSRMQLSTDIRWRSGRYIPRVCWILFSAEQGIHSPAIVIDRITHLFHFVSVM